MIIPIRCVTCNKMLGDKWIKYQQLIKTEGEVKLKYDFNMLKIMNSPELSALKNLELIVIAVVVTFFHILI